MIKEDAEHGPLTSTCVCVCVCVCVHVGREGCAQGSLLARVLRKLP
jgi:hypothetical protein